MKKVLITGSKGIVGRVLVNGLKESYSLFLADLPEFDIRAYASVLKLTQEKDAVIHLAWNTETENGNAIKQDPDNTKMSINIYEACIKNKVGRAIMASSIHATDYESMSEKEVVSPKKELVSKKTYGEHKRFLEKTGEIYASKGLEVICVRLGGVCDERGRTWRGLEQDGLAYPDLVSLFQRCLDAKNVPNNYTIIYGVSKNRENKFDLSNPFDWEPKFDSVDFYRLNANSI